MSLVYIGKLSAELAKVEIENAASGAKLPQAIRPNDEILKDAVSQAFENQRLVNRTLAMPFRFVEKSGTFAVNVTSGTASPQGKRLAWAILPWLFVALVVWFNDPPEKRRTNIAPFIFIFTVQVLSAIYLPTSDNSIGNNFIPHIPVLFVFIFALVSTRKKSKS